MWEKETCQQIYDENRERFIEEWKEFLRFPSISADPAYSDDCQRCADWLTSHLSDLGFQTELIETVGQPLVYAEYKGKPDRPTILYYGHYDVQPVDPLELWDSPPFEPEQRGDRLYARGAQDNKGQTIYVLKALETLLKQDALHCTVKLFLEGEEETGSYGISSAIPKLVEQGRLQGDVLMVCDTGAVAAGVSTITMGLRGIVYLQADLHGISHDLHSGSHGGIVKNPATELARLVETLHDQNGRIAVKGFYDGVSDIDPEDRKLANASPFNASDYEKQIGVPPVGGESEFTPVERKGFRPTIEVNGFHSGYGGPGSKTIIPDSAFVKLSSRLVGQQDPQKSLDRLVTHLEEHAPDGLKLTISDKGVGGPALMLSSQSPVIQQASEVLKQLSDKPTVYSWEGGSIPVVSSLAQASGAEPLLVGFGLSEDRIHAPNESFSIKQFELGFLYATMMLSQFSSTTQTEV